MPGVCLYGAENWLRGSSLRADGKACNLMKNKELEGNIYLLICAMIWGFAFVAQRVGSGYLPALTFNALRFTLGALSLLPLVIIADKKRTPKEGDRDKLKASLIGGAVCGVILFLGITFQQYGIAFTTVGKAGFITDMYIVFVPLLGLFMRRKVSPATWLSVIICVIGLYLISVTGNFSISKGDKFELLGAVVWAFHIMLIDHFSRKADPLKLSIIQFAVCAMLSSAASLMFEHADMRNVLPAIVPLLYAGVLSVGVAYTMQIFGQRHAKPSISAIIMSLESVFSCLGGAIILHENLGARGYVGCALMITGMLLSQLSSIASIRRNMQDAA